MTSARLVPLAFLGLVAFLPRAHAQALNQYFPNGVPGYDAGDGVTVQTRARPDYDYPPITLGGTTISPQFGENLGYDDNPYRRQHGSGSALAETLASVQIATGHDGDTAAASVAVDDTRYFSLPVLNNTNGNATLSLNHAFRDQDSLGFTYDYVHGNELPNGIGAAGFDQPVRYDINRVLADYLLSLNRVSLTPSLSFTNYSYADSSLRGVPAVESYRDRDVAEAALLARYALLPQESLVVVGRADNVHYLSKRKGFLTSDNNGYTLLGGVDFTTGALWHYRALIGYQYRVYNNPVVKNEGAVDAEISATYTPSDLTTITATVTRDITDASTADTIGYINTIGNLSIYHELYRNILLRGNVSYQRADYLQSTATSQAVYGGGAAVTYLINRYVRLSLSYDLNDGTGGPNSAYLRNLTLLKLEVGRSDF